MRFLASRLSFRIRFSRFDVVWAAIAPVFAIYLRALDVGFPTRFQSAELYCLITFLASLTAFLMFRIRDGIAHQFSVHDALEVTKAVVVTELLSLLVLFAAVRLEGIPRSTPIIHALFLASGLVMYRVLRKRRHDDQLQNATPEQSEIAECIVMIGSTRLASLYIRMVGTYSPQKCKFVAILDDNPRNIGNSIEGVRVVGPTAELEPVVHEFAEHGIVVNRVIIGGDRTMLAAEEMDVIDRACANLNLTLNFLPSLAGLQIAPAETAETKQAAPSVATTMDFQLPRYFRIKRMVDIVAGLTLFIILMPLIMVVACIVLLDVGVPILFWQQRIGVGGRPFLLHKFRTLKPLYNERGLPIGTSDRGPLTTATFTLRLGPKR